MMKLFQGKKLKKENANMIARIHFILKLIKLPEDNFKRKSRKENKGKKNMKTYLNNKSMITTFRRINKRNKNKR